MGRVVTFKLAIKPLGQSPRTIYVYLPNHYDPARKKPYPVLYMFDGHNLFYDKTATYGKSWGLKDYLDKNNIDLVVVGQDCNHTGTKRLDEYSPYPISQAKWLAEVNPEGSFTAEWFVKTLKPYCETHFNIYKKRDYVGIGGSSMGGLMSIYCISKYNKYFSKAACVSSALRPVIHNLLADIKPDQMNPNTRIYLDFGSEEVKTKGQLEKNIDCLLQVNHIFQDKGCITYPHLVMGGTHSEASWETILPIALPFLYEFNR